MKSEIVTGMEHYDLFPFTRCTGSFTPIVHTSRAASAKHILVSSPEHKDSDFSVKCPGTPAFFRSTTVNGENVRMASIKSFFSFQESTCTASSSCEEPLCGSPVGMGNQEMQKATGTSGDIAPSYSKRLGTTYSTALCCPLIPYPAAAASVC